jgi:alpha-aminoadipic semialdehyde synthase
MLVNAIYWHDLCPRLVTKEYLKNNIGSFKLDLISDISIDINGSIEFSVKATTPDNPAFVYNPLTDKITDGFDGEGVANITIDNLPTELPLDSSVSFSESLFPFVPEIMNSDFSLTYENINLPEEIKRALILHNGELTPSYKYLEKYLEKNT